MPFFHAKGMVVWNTLIDYWSEEHRAAGYVETKTPIILKRSLWEQSGHWDGAREEELGQRLQGRIDEAVAAAPVEDIRKIRLSANWMAAAGHVGEDARLYETVKAVAMELCPALGIAIPVGKDSMSMRTTWQDDGEGPVCVDCHSPHEIRKVTYQVGTKDCLQCHQDPALTIERDGQTLSLHVNGIDYLNSSHSGVSCAQCHTEVTPNHTERACATITAPVDCSICHAEVVDLRSLNPLDRDTFIASVIKTGRAVVVHEAPRTNGFGAEIVAQIE